MLFILCLLAFFAIALPDAMLGVAWPFMQADFGQPLAALTLVLPFGVAATLLSAGAWTWAQARFGLGRLLAAGTALSAAGLLCTAIAPAFRVVVGCAVLFGLSAGAVDAALNAYAAGHFGPRRITLMHAAYGVGAATSPLIVTVVVGSGASWRAAYIIGLVVQSVLAAVFAASVRRWPRTAGSAPGELPEPGPVPAEPGGQRQKRGIGGRAIGGLVLVAVESGLESAAGLWAFVFLFDGGGAGLGARTAGLVVSGYWIALVVGRVVLGAVAERTGTWPVVAGAAAAAIAAAALVASGRPAAAAGGIVLLGLAVAPIYPLLVLTSGERTAPAAVDRLVGFQAGASTVGSVAVAGGIGAAMGVSIHWFAAGVVILAVLNAAGIARLQPGRATVG